MKFDYIVNNNKDNLKEKKKNLKIFSKENVKNNIKYMLEGDSEFEIIFITSLLILFVGLLSSLAFGIIALITTLAIVTTILSFIFLISLILKSYSENLIYNYENNLDKMVNEFESFYYLVRDMKDYDNRFNLLYNNLSLARYKYPIESLTEFIEKNKNLIKLINKNYNICKSENTKEIFNNYDGPSILLNLFNITFKNLNLNELDFLEKETNQKNKELISENMKKELKEYLKNELNSY